MKWSDLELNIDYVSLESCNYDSLSIWKASILPFEVWVLARLVL